MTDVTGFGRRVRFCLRPAQRAAIAIAVIAGGCSADVARFDSANFNLNDPPEAEQAPPVPSEPVHHGGLPNNYVANSTPRGPYGAGANSVDVAALPEPAGAATPPAPPAYQPPQPAYQPARFGAATADRAPVEAPSASMQPGEQIEVQPGDTLYALSRKHRVSLAELMSVNGLTGPNLKPGQKLNLPGAQVAALTPAPRRPIETAAVPPASPETVAKYGATYTVQPGDSLYKIAKTHGANYAELQRVNGIKDVRKVRPGTVLKVPGATSAAETIASAPPSDITTPSTPATSAQPNVINGAATKVAALDSSANDASPEPPAATVAPPPEQKQAAIPIPSASELATSQSADSVKLRWPAQGKIIAGFGGRPDGTHNDGVNLSVPLGTDIHAAESGVVAYAGSELKGYGNLILIRHDNGWVTAYAHADELLVKRGDKIRRGQVIAKAGKTGSVDQPQVHFELRQGSKPVDPTPYMEKI